MITQDRIEKLEEAKELVSNACSLITEALKGSDAEDYGKVYVVDWLEKFAQEVSSTGVTIEGLIDRLYEDEQDAKATEEA